MVVNGVAAVIFLCCLAYAGYALWDNWSILDGSENALKTMVEYKPDEAEGLSYNFSQLMAMNPDVLRFVWMFFHHQISYFSAILYDINCYLYQLFPSSALIQKLLFFASHISYTLMCFLTVTRLPMYPIPTPRIRPTGNKIWNTVSTGRNVSRLFRNPKRFATYSIILPYIA